MNKVLDISTASMREINDYVHVAIKFGNLKILKGYIAAGANVNARDRYGWSPSEVASLSDHFKIAEYLKEQESMVNQERSYE